MSVYNDDIADSMDDFEILFMILGYIIRYIIFYFNVKSIVNHNTRPTITLIEHELQNVRKLAERNEHRIDEITTRATRNVVDV